METPDILNAVLSKLPRGNLSEAVVRAISEKGSERIDATGRWDDIDLDVTDCTVTWRDRWALDPLLPSIGGLTLGRHSKDMMRWPLPNLEHLDIVGVHLGEIITYPPWNLQTLRLVRVRTSGTDPEALRRWVRGLRVCTLELSDTQLGDALVAVIASELGPDVHQLEISHARFRRAGALAIAQAISRLDTLVDVSVRGNFIADVGFLAIASSACHRVAHLDVSDCGISCNGADAGIAKLSPSRSLLTLWAGGNHGEDSFKKAEMDKCSVYV